MQISPRYSHADRRITFLLWSSVNLGLGRSQPVQASRRATAIQQAAIDSLRRRQPPSPNHHHHPSYRPRDTARLRGSHRNLLPQCALLPSIALYTAQATDTTEYADLQPPTSTTHYTSNRGKLILLNVLLPSSCTRLYGSHSFLSFAPAQEVLFSAL